jgi:hypothetical protein
MPFKACKMHQRYTKKKHTKAGRSWEPGPLRAPAPGIDEDLRLTNYSILFGSIEY